MANTLADLIRPRRNLGFAGPEGEMINMLAMAPEDQMQPMNTIRTSSGEYITPGGGRSMQPVEFGGTPQPQFRGSPVDVFGQGKGYMQPDGTIVGVNAQGQRFAVNPAGTAAAGQAAKDAELKRRMMLAQVASEEARSQGGGMSPSDILAREKFEFEKKQAAAAGPKMTESQAKATTFASQMAAASNELDRLESAGFDPTATSTQLQTKLAGGLGNVFTSPEAQQAKQTQNQWSEAFLRVKTGAAATQPEVELNNKTFFPQIGDSPQVIEQKRRMRAQAEQDVLNMTGGGREVATKRIPQEPRKAVSQDAEAVAWARANPNDPRSARILQLAGGQ